MQMKKYIKICGYGGSGVPRKCLSFLGCKVADALDLNPALIKNFQQNMIISEMKYAAMAEWQTRWI